jgi:hypothetical protein
MSFAYQWERCDAQGSVCSPIEGATSGDYRLRARDVGKRIRVGVTAANADGAGGASTAPSDPIRRSRPTALALPRIRGSARSGGRLTSFGGTWWGSRPIRFAVQWLRCNETGRECHRIRGADRAAYRPVAADLGRRLRVRVRGQNRAGRRRATSEATALVRRVVDRSDAPANRLRVRLAANADATPRRASARLAPAR